MLTSHRWVTDFSPTRVLRSPDLKRRQRRFSQSILLITGTLGMWLEEATPAPRWCWASGPRLIQNCQPAKAPQPKICMDLRIKTLFPICFTEWNGQHYIIFYLFQKLLEFICCTFGILCYGLLSGRPASSSCHQLRRLPPPLAVQRLQKKKKVSKVNPRVTSPEYRLREKKLAVWKVVVHLQQVAPLVHLLDVFVGKDAAGSLQLALSLSRSSGDDGLVQTAHRQAAKTRTMIAPFSSR